jgi:tetratricopeptide (TPR) repeat protein
MTSIKRPLLAPSARFLPMTHAGRTSLQHSLFLTVAFLAVLSPAVVKAQSLAVNATLQGSVRDAAGNPVEDATVSLQSPSAETRTVLTDAKGRYQCSSTPGEYTLRVTKAGFSETTLGPFTLREGTPKTLDLTLKAKISPTPTSSGAPQFYDEPQFTVAGVADIANHGGHGSDTVSRTAQSLAKDIAALDKNAPTDAIAAPNTSEASLREKLARDPKGFQGNAQLGLHLAREGKSTEAIPFLEKAHQSHPEDTHLAFALAQAYADSGRLASARYLANATLAAHDEADLHHLLAEVDEKQRDPVAAVHEYQRAAELDPSEPNLFDWGTELLTHRALEPALQVFTKGNRLFPQSARLLVGLGVTEYAAGSPELAASHVCAASDIEPASVVPYLLLGKMQVVETGPSPCVTDKLERFARLHPENALANYYYASRLWTQRKESDSPDADSQIESLLNKAIQLDPHLALAHLQLGMLWEERKDDSKAISAYQSAIAADPRLPEPHYRLAQVYRRTGQTAKAQDELTLSEQLSQKTSQQAEQEAREIPQFVYTLRHPAPPPQ